ncbi:Exopolyphosphatase [Alienimonas californiensis]|uniref:Exopolyphosphatase n=1 Tax=Alienimonas californiensis TaxID=2527989 RepID=A0A517P702_9PLAN|nr:Exopolyphosphatase [Alienimonas californiensis]
MTNAPAPPLPVAVIDVGATAMRLALAEVAADGSVRPLEHLTRAVNLGKDVFTDGAITPATMESCVAVLRDYRRVLEQYDLSPGGRGLSGGGAGGAEAGGGRLRVVATSAVREATNRLTFLDRIFAATGIEIEPIDEAETTRVTYLGVLPYLQADPALHEATAAVAEVGGGTTDLLAIRGGDVRFSQSYRVGALRMREAVRAAAGASPRHLWERQADRAARRMAADLPEDASALVALGADVRFAANHLMPPQPGAGEEPEAGPDAAAQRLPLSCLREFLDDAFARTEDELARLYHLPFEQAETLRPALLVNLRLAEALGLEEMVVAEVHLRDGLIRDTAARGDWTDRAAAQAVQSAVHLGRRYRVDTDHARQVARLADRLFEQLAERHRLDARHGRLLSLAALLHEIGLFVGTTGYHKHSMYLIANSDLFGVSRRDLSVIGLVARYHRRASPKATHTPFTQMDRPERVAVAKLAAILRLAKALDESRSGRVKDVIARVDGDRLILTAPGVDDLSLERLAVKQSGPLFREIFGLRVLLRGG